MNVASLENCKRLYELSGWSKTNFAWAEDNYHYPMYRPATLKTDDTPAYDLGYLIRKLPVNLEYVHKEKDWVDGSDLPEVKIRGNVYVGFTAQSKATAGYGGMRGHFYLQYADTPEDAACLLAIKLFEENLLKPSINKGEI